MEFTATLKNAKRLARNVWMASVQPADLLKLGGSAPRPEGRTSVIYVGEMEPSSPGDVSFNPRNARLLSIGTGSDLVIVFRGEGAPSSVASSDTGLSAELRLLPVEMAEPAQALIAAVAERFPGRLEPSESGRYVYRPDNFWTLKVQPRDKSLAVTLYGRADQFGDTGEVALLADRGSYSRFKIERVSQFPDAVRTILAAGELKRR
jgi:hypothetical protein